MYKNFIEELSVITNNHPNRVDEYDIRFKLAEKVAEITQEIKDSVIWLAKQGATKYEYNVVEYQQPELIDMICEDLNIKEILSTKQPLDNRILYFDWKHLIK